MAKKNRGINIFQNVPKADTPRTQFPIRHTCDFSGEFGYGYPVFCQEVLPGDTWHITADHFSRLAPMIAPVYHDFDVRMHWFFVPMRLLWDDFEDWMTGGKNGTWREDNPDSFPMFSLRRVANTTTELIGGLFDFLGVNTCYDGKNVEGSVSSFALLPVMPVRGYGLIWNYFYRDQNVMDEAEISTASGVDNLDWMFSFAESLAGGLFKVAWDKDYFTSATLSPQRGPQVFIPLGDTAPVSFTNELTVRSKGGVVQAYDTDGAVPPFASLQSESNVATSDGFLGQLTADSMGYTASLNSTATLTPAALNVSKPVADLSSAQGAAVDDVREAFALQRFFERMQVIGSRFAEFLRGIWGTNAGDARLQMPEYLGTWRNPFMINNVSNTTGTATNPQAGYAGNGLSSQYNSPIEKYFPEYGYLYCIYSVLPRNGYQQGLAPIFCRTEWLDFANPMFEHIGEQPISMKELYYDPADTTLQNDETFGYQSQYASYKFVNSHSHGDFKQSLNFWHANRIFDNKPTLSQSFIEYDSSESTDRVFVLTDQPKYYTTIEFGGYAERNLSAYSTPRLI